MSDRDEIAEDAPRAGGAPDRWGFETRAIHAGQQPDPVTGAVVPPISVSTTFAKRGVGRHGGFEYSRSANPTRAALEACLASLEGARHGFAFASGLAAEDAVLNANYVRAGLSDLMSLPFGDKPCMHEVLFDDAWLKDTGVTTLDFAKAMIDEGYHPMTMYFPLVVHGAMLIEPTESESKASLDLFVAALRDLAMAAKRCEAERFSGAPYDAPRRRLDETRAARQPILKWAPPKPLAEAAE